MSGNDDGAAAARRREAIAYHEAGHAVVGQVQGLRVNRLYLGDASGRVIFDDQWSEDAVLADAALLDRYAMMLLAATSAEWRHTGTVVGASGDVAALSWLLRQARERGTVPRPDRWRRADAEAERHWSEIEAVADELTHHGAPVAAASSVLTHDPQLGTTVDEVSGARLRELLAAQQRDPP